MARVAISKTTVGATGINITGATYSTLATGTDNGVDIDYEGGLTAALKNDTGGAAVFTIPVGTPASYSTYSLTVPSITVSVADGVTHLYKLPAIAKLSTGKVGIDCDVAGKVAILKGL